MATTTKTKKAATFEDGDGTEQLPVSVTLWVGKNKAGDRVLVMARTLLSGSERLRNPETGRPVKMSGDVAAFGNDGDPEGPAILRLWWRDAWVDVPTMADFGAWTFGEQCETPDGTACDPDAPESWLRLCGLV
jgi:hypothetical protein